MWHFQRQMKITVFGNSYIRRDFGSVFDHVSFHDEVIQQTVLIREDEVFSRSNVLRYLLVRIRPVHHKYKINH